MPSSLCPVCAAWQRFCMRHIARTPASSGWFPARSICKYLIGRLFVAHGSFHEETIWNSMETLLGFCSLPFVFMVHAKPEKHKTVSPNSKQWKNKAARVTICAGKICSSKSKPAKLTPEFPAFPCHRKEPPSFKVGESRKMPQQIRWVIYDQFRPDVTLQMKN